MKFYYYNKLGTKSRRYWHKLANNPKKLAKANFRIDLLKRLSKQTGKTTEQIYIELYKELYEWIKDYK